MKFKDFDNLDDAFEFFHKAGINKLIFKCKNKFRVGYEGDSTLELVKDGKRTPKM